MKLGGGREKKEDDINYAVGLEMNVKKGDKVKEGDLLCTVYHDQELTEEWIESFYDTFSYTKEKTNPIPIVEEILG